MQALGLPPDKRDKTCVSPQFMTRHRLPPSQIAEGIEKTRLTLETGFLDPAREAGLVVDGGLAEAARDAGLAEALDAGFSAALDAGFSTFDAGLSALAVALEAGLALDAGLAYIASPVRYPQTF